VILNKRYSRLFRQAYFYYFYLNCRVDVHNIFGGSGGIRTHASEETGESEAVRRIRGLRKIRSVQKIQNIKVGTYTETPRYKLTRKGNAQYHRTRRAAGNTVSSTHIHATTHNTRAAATVSVVPPKTKDTQLRTHTLPVCVIETNVSAAAVYIILCSAIYTGR